MLFWIFSIGFPKIEIQSPSLKYFKLLDKVTNYHLKHIKNAWLGHKRLGYERALHCKEMAQKWPYIVREWLVHALEHISLYHI